MRCHICDSALAEVHYNADFKDYEPCPHCLLIIQDTIAGFTDRPAVEDDELGCDEPLAAYRDLVSDDFSPD